MTVEECCKLILESLQMELDKMSFRIENRDTASKTYWAILKRLLR